MTGPARRSACFPNDHDAVDSRNDERGSGGGGGVRTSSDRPLRPTPGLTFPTWQENAGLFLTGLLHCRPRFSASCTGTHTAAL